MYPEDHVNKRPAFRRTCEKTHLRNIYVVIYNVPKYMFFYLPASKVQGVFHMFSEASNLQE